MIADDELGKAREDFKIPLPKLYYNAFETGFSEQSAFSRAFKNRTNQSPVKFRKIQ